MMSVETIIHLEKMAAVYAYEQGLEPYQLSSPSEVFGWRSGVPIPNLGGLRPDGWRLVDTAFVDKTGLDSTGPAMDMQEFKNWVYEKATEDETAGFAIVEEGQFQLYVGYFTQDDSIEVNEDAYLPSGFEVNEDTYTYCPGEDCGALMLVEDDYCEQCGWSQEDEDNKRRLEEAPFHKGDHITVWACLFDAGAEHHFEPTYATVIDVDVDAETIDLEDEEGNVEWNVPWNANGIIKDDE